MSDDIFALPLQCTLFFPVSANPVGFNHFAAAEWLLRGNPAWRNVVFIPSNGHHPDPTKADAELPQQARLELLRSAIAEVAMEDRSHLARLAAQTGEALRIGAHNLFCWPWEFSFPRAVPTAETVAAIRDAHAADEAKINWFAGSDLVTRMGDARIFSSDDLTLLSSQCHYAIMEREGYPLDKALESLAATRGVELAHQSGLLGKLPPWLAPFLELSSTSIRNAAEAGDPLGAMLPAGAAEMILAEGHYRPGRAAARLVDRAGEVLEERSALQLELARLGGVLEEEAGRLCDRLAHNHGQGAAHTFSLVEASVGGLLTAAFAGRSGASRYFFQSRFAYDERAKRSLIGEGKAPSAVSDKMALALARGMREQGKTDFALAESGMAGPPDGQRRSFKNGLCHMALVTPKGEFTHHARFNPFLTRKEHQHLFAIEALARVNEWMAEDGY